MQTYDNENGKLIKGDDQNKKPLFRKNHLDFSIPIWEKVLFFLLGLIGLQFIAVIVTFVVSLTSLVSEEGLSSIGSAVINFVSYLILLIIFALVFILDKRKNYKILWENLKQYKDYIFSFICFICIYLVNIIFNAIFQNVPFYGENSNQDSIVEMVKSTPILLFFMVVIFGPICEEITYRVGLCDLIGRKNKWAGIILSSLIFALIHFDYQTILNCIIDNSETIKESYEAIGQEISEEEINAIITNNNHALLNELMNFPIYFGSGFCLAFFYNLTGNIFTSTFAHMLVNLLSYISIIMSLKTGNANSSESASLIYNFLINKLDNSVIYSSIDFASLVKLLF